MRGMLGLAALGSGLMLIGCAISESWQVVYLKTAQDQATQPEVRQRLGPPRHTTAAETGNQSGSMSIGGTNTGIVSASREVGAINMCSPSTHKPFSACGFITRNRHRGEMMPLACSSGSSAPRG